MLVGSHCDHVPGTSDRIESGSTREASRLGEGETEEPGGVGANGPWLHLSILDFYEVIGVKGPYYIGIATAHGVRSLAAPAGVVAIGLSLIIGPWLAIAKWSCAHGTIAEYAACTGHEDGARHLGGAIEPVGWR